MARPARAEDARDAPDPVYPVDEAHVALGAGSHLAFGTAPTLAVSSHVSAEVATGRWSLRLEGRYDLPSSGGTTLGTARTALAGGSFVPCLRARGTWACGVVLASRETATATDAAGASARDAWFVVGVGARLEMHFSLPFNLALRLGAEVLGHPISHYLAVNGQRIFKTSAVSMTFGPSIVHAF